MDIEQFKEDRKQQLEQQLQQANQNVINARFQVEAAETQLSNAEKHLSALHGALQEHALWIATLEQKNNPNVQAKPELSKPTLREVSRDTKE